jgi:hypothetical protein
VGELSRITPIQKIDGQDLETARIPVNYLFGKDYNEIITKCFEMVYMFPHGLHGKTLMTIFKLLRENDVLTLEWRKDSFTNEYQRKAGLHTDVLLLHVDRKEKRKYSFLIDTGCCADNSARMIRGYKRD